jgi:uncharacterized coiled-coil protein SlyX
MTNPTKSALEKLGQMECHSAHDRAVYYVLKELADKLDTEKTRIAHQEIYEGQKRAEMQVDIVGHTNTLVDLNKRLDSLENDKSVQWDMIHGLDNRLCKVEQRLDQSQQVKKELLEGLKSYYEGPIGTAGLRMPNKCVRVGKIADEPAPPTSGVKPDWVEMSQGTRKQFEDRGIKFSDVKVHGTEPPSAPKAEPLSAALSLLQSVFGRLHFVPPDSDHEGACADDYVDLTEEILQEYQTKMGDAK